MNKTLFIIRHGEAEQLAPENKRADHTRKLTEYGQRQVEALAQHCKARVASLQPESVAMLCSPFTRTRDTAAIIAKHLGVNEENVDALTPENSASSALASLAKHREPCIFLVSHMPLVAHLRAFVLDGNENSSVLRAFHTAECAELRCSEFLAGCGVEI